MASIPKDVREFMTKWSVTDTEIWPVPGGKSYAVKHSALERIAAEQGIVFGPPHIIESLGTDKVYSLWVDARMGDRIEWSTGEASPANNKNAYPLAMAEKRAKDRCVLKLLAAHGLVYSEDEADAFKQAYEAPGEPIPIKADPDVPKLSAHAIKRDKPDLWPTIVSMFRDAKSYDELKEVAAGEFVKRATADWPLGWIDALRDEFSTCATALREQAA